MFVRPGKQIVKPQQYKCNGPCPCSGGSGNSGPGFGNTGGGSNQGSGIPSGFTPCNCCQANRPAFCDRLADFDCGNCEIGSNEGSGVPSNPCDCCSTNPPPICDRLADFDCDNCLANNQNVLSCVCPDVYRPVCGNDGRTYSNSCEANCKGRLVRKRLTDYFQGEHD